MEELKLFLGRVKIIIMTLPGLCNKVTVLEEVLLNLTMLHIGFMIPTTDVERI